MKWKLYILLPKKSLPPPSTLYFSSKIYLVRLDFYA